MKSPCVAYPADEPLVLIRASQVRLCDGNHCAAALLSYFGYWHTIRLEQTHQAEHANKVAALHGEPGTQETTLLQYHTEDAIETGLLHLYGRKTIRAALALLVKKGFLSIHGNPNPRYRFDKTHYFLFHPEAVQAEISTAVHEVKVPHREGQNTSSRFTGENSIDIDESEYSVHEVKVPDREGVFAASSGKTAAPIAEITSEITEEKKTDSLTTFESLPGDGSSASPPGTATALAAKTRRSKVITPLAPQSWTYRLLQDHAESFDVEALNDQAWWQNMAKSLPEFTQEFVSLAFADLANWLRTNPRRVPHDRKGWLKRMGISLNYYFDHKYAKRGPRGTVAPHPHGLTDKEMTTVISGANAARRIQDAARDTTTPHDPRRQSPLLPRPREDGPTIQRPVE